MPEEIVGEVDGVQYSRHVSPEEAARAASPEVGDGTPQTAPEQEPDEFVKNPDPEEDGDMGESSLLPTNKLISAAVTALILFVISRFTEVDKDVEQAVNVLAPLVVAYFTRNKKTPGGVPVK
jgi:hypothetical protein